MPTSSNYIITGNPTGDINTSLAANGYDKGNNNSQEIAIGRVLSINEDRSISYEILNNSLSPSLLGTPINNGIKAYPINKNIIRLPVVGELVELIRGPEVFSTSNNPAQFSQTIYYGNPLSVWQDTNNNVVENNNNINSQTNTNVSINSYKQSSMGF